MIDAFIIEHLRKERAEAERPCLVLPVPEPMAYRPAERPTTGADECPRGSVDVDFRI